MIRAVLFAATLMAALVPAAAEAQGLPVAFMVKDVATNDALNVRAEPSAAAPILGTISPDATNVEVIQISADGKWGRVSTSEGNGWVAMRYLEPMPILDPAKVPRPLTCLGTEPFWSIGLTEGGAEWMTPDEPRTDLNVSEEAVAPTGFFIRAEDGPERLFRLTISREWCSDGMSDREFGFAAKLFIEAPDGNLLAAGCCTLDQR